MLTSKDANVNAVRDFHKAMDGTLQELPQAFDGNTAFYRASFKLEELVEFLQAASSDQADFDRKVQGLHQQLDKAVAKVTSKGSPGLSLVGQVDALMDLLYFTYGSFVLVGVDPKPIFDIVHQANMGKLFPDGKAHYDPVSHKILKPEGWEERFAPEGKIQDELDRQKGRKS
ncbi:HAD family hydrolase [Streptococcus suis]|uniref:HAD family hydrolase n=1 Tax=Streptococcus suis TaxID=1307 RepID=A0A426TE23_STRSU|nr:HAD family hydrolase [Streptococcus suis]